jgi:tetratricopeptide (TPR) repeat protein
MNPFPPSIRALTAVCLLLGLLGMFLTSFSMIKDTFAERFRPKNISAAQSAGKAGFAALPGQSEAAGPVDGEARTDPQDAEALLGLAEELLAAGEWRRAEKFLEQVIGDRPMDTRFRHLLGVCLFRQNKSSEAAKIFEDMIRTQEDPIALYNLAILYKHRLNLPEAADSLLRRALNAQDLDPELAVRLREELDAAAQKR